MDLNDLEIDKTAKKTENVENTNEDTDPNIERIKKIRIPKLEKKLREDQDKVNMDYFRELAKNYIKDRLRRLNRDKEYLEKLRKASSENKKINKYANDRIVSILEEEEILRNKLKDLEEGETISLDTDAEKDGIFDLDLKKVTGYGILFFIMGISLIYLGSEYGLIAIYGIVFIIVLVFALIMSILGIF